MKTFQLHLSKMPVHSNRDGFPLLVTRTREEVWTRTGFARLPTRDVLLAESPEEYLQLSYSVPYRPGFIGPDSDFRTFSREFLYVDSPNPGALPRAFGVSPVATTTDFLYDSVVEAPLALTPKLGSPCIFYPLGEQGFWDFVSRENNLRAMTSGASAPICVYAIYLGVWNETPTDVTLQFMSSPLPWNETHGWGVFFTRYFQDREDLRAIVRRQGTQAAVMLDEIIQSEGIEE